MTDHIRTLGLLQPATKPPTEAHSGHSICVPEMGIGATPDAIRWATIGYLNELLRDYEKINAAPVGRPTSEFMDKVPQRRAFMLWALVNRDPISPNLRRASTRELSHQFRGVGLSSASGLSGNHKFAKKYTENYSQTTRANKLHSLPPSATTCERFIQCYHK